MPTILNKFFKVCDVKGGSFNARGKWEEGTASLRNVKGTIQALNSRDSVLIVDGSRDIGSCKVYSSSKLYFRKRDGEGNKSFIIHSESVYEVIDLVHFDNNLISHFKYICDLVPTNQIPDKVKEAFGL